MLRMADIISSERGEIIEEPLASEAFERLPEPDGISAADDKVKMWRARIDVARKIREIKFKTLNTLINYYEGIQWFFDDKDESVNYNTDRATVNLIFANIKGNC